MSCTFKRAPTANRARRDHRSKHWIACRPQLRASLLACGTAVLVLSTTALTAAPGTTAFASPARSVSAARAIRSRHSQISAYLQIITYFPAR